MSDRRPWLVPLALAGLAACTSDSTPRTPLRDAGHPDDAGMYDAAMSDAGAPRDAGAPHDAAVPDAEVDAGGPRVLALEFERLALPGNLKRPSDFAFVPGTHEVLVTEKGKAGAELGARVLHYDLSGSAAVLLGTFEVPGVFDEGDCGLISLAFDPAFAENGYVYFGYCDSFTSSTISRHEFDPRDYGRVATSTRVVLRAGDPGALEAWHNVGDIGFDHEGHMWALLGDKTVRERAQDLSEPLGSVVRIDPRLGDQEGYEPVPGNPFVGMDGRDPSIVAYGLRSPWRGALDRYGHLWIGDVGDNEQEEVNLLTAWDGTNFGWPLAEGPCLDGCTGLVDPVISWPHDLDAWPALADPQVEPSVSRAVWVGVEYQAGERDPYDGLLDHRLLYGDFAGGWIRAAQIDAEGHLLNDQHVGHLAGPTAWVQGPDGYLYVTTYGSYDGSTQAGGMYRAVLGEPFDPGDAGAAGSPFEDPDARLPVLLSDLGLYPDLRDLTSVREGVRSYEPRWPLWSNGADKLRHVYLPGPVHTQQRDAWEFPVGTMFFKTFSFGTEGSKRLVETRLMRRRSDRWEFAVYKWRDEGDDAVLTNGIFDITVDVEQDGEHFTHDIPSTARCRGCHEAAPVPVLGFGELQLNHGEWLTRFADVLEPVPPQAPDVIDDADPRTRDVLGYLTGNCVHCHNGGEFSANTSFDMRHGVALANLVNHPTESSASAPGLRVVPGQPEESVLFRAFGRTDAEAKPMPPMGVQRRDELALTLLREWILALPVAP